MKGESRKKDRIRYIITRINTSTRRKRNKGYVKLMRATTWKYTTFGKHRKVDRRKINEK